MLERKPLPKGSLVVFDEVQAFPRAREAVKPLVADGRYHYVETGSLISIRKTVEGILIPSEERHVKMYPMDFEEFLWANGDGGDGGDQRGVCLKGIPRTAPSPRYGCLPLYMISCLYANVRNNAPSGGREIML